MFHSSDWVLRKSLREIVEDRTSLLYSHVDYLCKFFESGKDTAYIVRYKLHNTDLDLDDVRRVKENFRFAQNLNKDVKHLKEQILHKIEDKSERDKVETRLKCVEDYDEYDEIRREFGRPSKHTVLVEEARNLGLQQYADAILNCKFVHFKNTAEALQMDRKKLEDLICVLVADTIHKSPEVKEKIVKITTRPLENSLLNIRVKINEKKLSPDLRGNYLRLEGKVPKEDNIHQIMKLDRASQKDELKWSTFVKIGDVEKEHPYFKHKVHPKMQEWFTEVVQERIRTYFMLAIGRRGKTFLQSASESLGGEILQKNLSELFMQKGVSGSFVVGVDPGYNTVKLALIDELGKYLGGKNFRIVPYEMQDEKSKSLNEYPQFREKDEAVLLRWAQKAKRRGKKMIFSLGDGMNHYNTELAIWDMKNRGLFDKKVSADIHVVSETGASWYSISDRSMREFPPGTPPGQQSAASIARRLLNPLNEFVKIDPKRLSKGQYQHSMPAKLMDEMLAEAARDTISLQGVDLNLAGIDVLKHVCGLNEQLASDIIYYRERTEHGRFRDRQELRNIDGMTEEIFEDCAGFLKIFEGDNLLDSTFVHPVDYLNCERMLDRLWWSVDYLRSTERVDSRALSHEELRLFDLIRLEPDYIPAPEPQSSPPICIHRPEGQTVKGVVNSCTTFGVFITLPLGMKKKVDGLALKKYFRENEDQKCEYPRIGTVIDVEVCKVKKDFEGEDKYFCKPVLKLTEPKGTGFACA